MTAAVLSGEPSSVAALALLMAAAAVFWLAQRRARERRMRFDALHAAVFALLLDEPSSDLAGRIEGALATIGSILGLDRAWLLAGAEGDVFYGWSADSALTHEAAAASTARIVGRFPWDGNMILVEPGERSTASWSDRPAGRRGTPASALLMRSQEHQDVALLGFVATDRWLVYPDTVRGLAAALQTSLQLERRRRMEAERVALDRKLALGRRMESIGALASGLAHNLNNILHAIDAFRETAALHVPATGVVAGNLGEIGQAVNRASGLVADVLRFGRRVEGPAETVSLDELLAETMKLLAASLPREVELTWQPVAEPMRVEGDFGQLQQVLLNLCSNAANAMPAGGAIACTAVLRLLDDPVRLSHGVLRRGRYATIAVADEGRGIPAEAIPHLFDAFYTTRETGTGLGLSTAREIVEGVGGAIDVDSVVGVGSRFTVWLPLAADEAAAPPDDASRGAGETVLIVNTDGRRLSNDEELLAALGYEPIGITDLDATIGIDAGIDVAVVASLDPRLADEIAARLRAAGLTAPLLIAVPQPEPGPAALRYPFQPAMLAHALARQLEATDAAA